MRRDRAEGGPSAEPTGVALGTAADVGQATDLPLDAHLHTDRSSDADVPIDSYAADAVARRIPELAITDHVDFEPGWPNHAPDVRARERTVREAAERWAEAGLAIRFGVEVTYQASREAEIREHLARMPYDFVIGSVHVGPDSPYYATRVRAWTTGRSLPAIVAPYFGEVTAAARSGLFDAIGHLDFAKRYLLPYVTPAELAGAPELYAPVLRALVESGAALEVNTSGLRQVPRETYPSAAIVALFRELGGRRVSAGSDAHRREAFAFGLQEGYAALADAGFEELAFRRGTDRVLDRVAVAIPEWLISRSRSAERPAVRGSGVVVPDAVPNARGGASL